MLPPRAGLFVCSGQPLVRVRWQVLIAEVLRLRITRRIQDALDMTAGGQDELALTTQHPGRRVARFPWCDVVGHAGEDDGVEVHPRQVDPRPEQLQGAVPGERIVEIQVEKVAVQPGRQVGGVVVPVQDVEYGRALAQQVVVDPIIPDQVVGAQPREHLRQLLSLQHSFRTRGLPGRLDRLSCCEQPKLRLCRSVEDGDHECSGVDLSVASGGEVT